MKTGMPLAEARSFADGVVDELAGLGVEMAEVSGSLLREERFIGDIDLLVFGDLARVAILSKDHRPGWRVVSGGDSSLTLEVDGQQVNLFRASPENIGSFRMTYTGPKNYVIAYRMKAKRMGWTLNQYGLFDENGKLLEARSEERIFELLGKSWKEPKRRGKR